MASTIVGNEKIEPVSQETIEAITSVPCGTNVPLSLFNRHASYVQC